MRVFTILGIVFTVIGAGLVIVAFMPNSGGIEGETTGMGAGIAAITLLPMGIIFTIIGVGVLAGDRRPSPTARDGHPGAGHDPLGRRRQRRGQQHQRAADLPVAGDAAGPGTL